MYKKQIKAALFSALLALLLTNAVAQSTPEPFVAWTFDAVETPQYWYGTSYMANFGNFPTATLYADGNYGSSQFATVTTSNYAQMLKSDWLGTELGDPRPEAFDGYCLGFKHPNSAGRSFVLACPTTLYHNLSLRYAVTRSATGFKKMKFAWSLTGAYSSYQTIATKPCDALDFEVQELNLEGMTALEDQPMIYIRITIDSIGSTAYQGNIKFDNICLLGSKCMDTLHVQDTIISGENYYDYGFFLQNITGDGDYIYNRRVRFTDRCDSLYQLHLHVTDTTAHVIPTDTTTTDTTEVGGDTTSIPLWISQPLIQVYPNPAYDHLTITVPDGLTIDGFSIYNSIGIKVFTTVTKTLGAFYMCEDDFSFSIQDLEPGIYFLHWHGHATGHTGGVIKFVKL